MRIPSNDELRYMRLLAESIAFANTGPSWVTFHGQIKRPSDTQKALILQAFLLGYEMNIEPLTMLDNVDYISQGFRLSAHLWSKIIRENVPNFNLEILEETNIFLKIRFTDDGKKWTTMSLDMNDCPDRFDHKNMLKVSWRNFPQDMLWGQLISRMGRRFFSHLLGGRRYTQSEIEEPNSPVNIVKEIKEELQIPQGDNLFGIPLQDRDEKATESKVIPPSEEAFEEQIKEMSLPHKEPPKEEEQIIIPKPMKKEVPIPKVEEKAASKPFLKPFTGDEEEVLEPVEPPRKAVKKSTKKSTKKPEAPVQVEKKPNLRGEAPPKREPSKLKRGYEEDPFSLKFLGALAKKLTEEDNIKFLNYLDEMLKSKEKDESWLHFVQDYYDTWLSITGYKNRPSLEEVEEE